MQAINQPEEKFIILFITANDKKGIRPGSETRPTCIIAFAKNVK
jgi:hypothetical protein